MFLLPAHVARKIPVVAGSHVDDQRDPREDLGRWLAGFRLPSPFPHEFASHTTTTEYSCFPWIPVHFHRSYASREHAFYCHAAFHYKSLHSTKRLVCDDREFHRQEAFQNDGVLFAKSLVEILLLEIGRISFLWMIHCEHPSRGFGFAAVRRQQTFITDFFRRQAGTSNGTVAQGRTRKFQSAERKPGEPAAAARPRVSHFRHPSHILQLANIHHTDKTEWKQLWDTHLPRELQLHILSYLRPMELMQVHARAPTLPSSLLALSHDRSLHRTLRLVSVPGWSHTGSSCMENQLSVVLLHALHPFLREIRLSGLHSLTHGGRITDETIVRICDTCGHNLQYLELSNGTASQLTNVSLRTIGTKCSQLRVLKLSNFLTRLQPAPISEGNVHKSNQCYDEEGLLELLESGVWHSLRALDIHWTRRIRVDRLLEWLAKRSSSNSDRPRSTFQLDARFCRFSRKLLAQLQRHYSTTLVLHEELDPLGGQSKVVLQDVGHSWEVVLQTYS